jgi:hypothetical protein
MCSGTKEAPVEDTAPEEDTAANILTIEEQRALRSEFSIEVDKRISDRNFDEEYEKLKKEIEEDQ